MRRTGASVHQLSSTYQVSMTCSTSAVRVAPRGLECGCHVMWVGLRSSPKVTRAGMGSLRRRGAVAMSHHPRNTDATRTGRGCEFAPTTKCVELARYEHRMAFGDARPGLDLEHLQYRVVADDLLYVAYSCL